MNQSAPRVKPRIINKYRGTCRECGVVVGARMGIATRENDQWVVYHRFCKAHVDVDETAEGYRDVPQVEEVDESANDWSRAVGYVVTRFSSGHTVVRNARGRCEDAPCCGCCD